MPSLAGPLILRVRRRPGPGQVEIISNRSQRADRLLIGTTPTEAEERVGRLFTLCRQAQCLAIRAACAAAQSGPMAEFPALQRAVLMEMALEHAWRLLVDWPMQVGQPADFDSLRLLRRAALLGPMALADALDTQLAHGWPKINAVWATASEAPTASGDHRDSADRFVPFLPPVARLDPVESDALAWQALEESAFCARPLWQQQPAETGPLARQQQPPLLAGRLKGTDRIKSRWLARCLELAELPTRLRQAPSAVLLARPLAEHCGYAWVETARGALLHVVHLQRGQVVACRLIAPTEWNFHPDGPFTAGIHALGTDRPDLARAAQALALSLDPCVRYQVEVLDA